MGCTDRSMKPQHLSSVGTPFWKWLRSQLDKKSNNSYNLSTLYCRALKSTSGKASIFSDISKPRGLLILWVHTVRLYPNIAEYAFKFNRRTPHKYSGTSWSVRAYFLSCFAYIQTIIYENSQQFLRPNRRDYIYGHFDHLVFPKLVLYSIANSPNLFRQSR